MKRNIFLGLMVVGTILIYSCTRESLFENTIDQTGIDQLSETHFVPLDAALHIADLQKNPHAKGSAITEYLEFKKNGDRAEFYIINYPQAGFIIIPGDDRLIPILAYSENSHFPLCDSIIPWGVTDWLNSVSSFVDSIRQSDMEQNASVKYNWESVIVGKNPIFKPASSPAKTDYCSLVWEWGEENDQDDCGRDGNIIGEFYYYVPELLDTEWGQADGYNEEIAYGGCETTLNGRYLVGCVAVAVGQVMLENRFPTSFDWDGIFNDGFPFGEETNTFLRDIGLSGNLNMSYGCYASLAYESDAINYLISSGYTSTSSTYTISSSTILSNVRYGYPVIFSGGSSGSRHMWVCDGIQSFYNVVCFAAGGSYDYRYEYNGNRQYLHMNWGWYGNYDGWFSMYNFNPGGFNFNYNKRLIYNIIH